jgi:hypothetical protein
MPEAAADQFEYDVALSYAGEDREYVGKVAAGLAKAGVEPFYDVYEEADMWGEELGDRLTDVYQERARYCVVFLSAAYAAKMWTNHELKSAQTRAFRENRRYLFPVRFDDTPIPRSLRTRVFLDLRKKTPQELVELILEKVRAPEQPGKIARAEARKKERRRRQIRQAAVAALVLAAVLWYVTAHLRSSTTMAVGAAQAKFIIVRMSNSGWKPSLLVTSRLKFDGVPVEDAELVPIDADAYRNSVPAAGFVDIRLRPKGGELIPRCRDGRYVPLTEIVDALPQRQVSLEVDVREAGLFDGERQVKREVLDAKRLREFITDWVPDVLPRRC